MIMTCSELKDLVKTLPVLHREAKVWTIKFAIPRYNLAVIHVIEKDTARFVVNCFTFDETRMIRKLVRFGSNTDQKPTSWELLSGYLEFLAIAVPNEREQIVEDDELADKVWRLQHGDNQTSN